MLVATDSGYTGEQEDGLVGLGFSPLSEGYPTFVESLKTAGVISSSIFAMFLNNNGKSIGYGSFSSNLEIGTYNLAKYSKSLKFAVTMPVVSPAYYWNVVFSSVSVGSFKLSSVTTTIDSGSTNMLIPSTDYSNFISHLKSLYSCKTDSYGRFYCNCSCANQLTNITLTYNSVNLYVPSNNLWTFYSPNQCYLNAQQGSSNWLLGDIFLQNYYTLYDMDNLQISFTEAIYSNASTLTGSCTSYAHSLFAANILGYILGIILVYF